MKSQTKRKKAPLAERFSRFVRCGKEGECILWTGSTKFGYGQIRHKNKTLFAHRVAWEISNGEIPDGICVLHKCDNRLCVNVQHLFLGTKSDNSADMVRKGRQSRSMKGRKSILTQHQVDQIREMHGEDWTHEKLAEKFKVSTRTISDILLRRTWKSRHA